MSASATDKFKKLTNNFSTTLSGAIVGAGDTSMSLTSATNLPTDTGTVFVIDRVDSAGALTPTTREYVKGVVSGTSVTGLVRGLGGSTAQAHSTGAVVEQVVDQNTINDLMDGILAQHAQDGTHKGITTDTMTATGTVQGATVVATGDNQIRSVSLETIKSETSFDHVASGCVITADAAGSTLKWSMTSGVVYIGGKRVVVSAITSDTATASKDTYVDVDNTGTVTRTGGNIVANNAASPVLAANSIRLGIIVTGASSIAAAGSINQGQEDRVLPIASSIPYAVTDSLGNLICPRDPNRKILGYRQITNYFTLSSSQTTPTQITGISVPVIVPTGRKIALTLACPDTEPAGGGVAQIQIWLGTVNSGTPLVQAQSIATNASLTGIGIYTPSSNSLTLNGGVLNSVLSNVTLGAALTKPIFLKVELV